MNARRSWFGWMRLLAVAAVVPVLGCGDLPPDVLYPCETDGGCELHGSVRYQCGADRVCRPPDAGEPEKPDAGKPDAGKPDAGEPDKPDAGMDGGSDAGSDGGGPFVTPDAPICAPSGGWCWENPVSAGRSLLAVRGSGPNDVWAVGDKGIVLHWNGLRWTRLEPLGTQSLRSMGQAGGDWWVVGDYGTLRQWDGARWKAQDLTYTIGLNHISEGHGGGSFIVGTNGTVLAFNSGGWSPQAVKPSGEDPPPSFNAVWDVSSGEGWAVGDNGALFHGVNGGWSPAVSPISTNATLRGISASAPEALAVGNSGTVIHWTGSNWENVGPIAGAGDLAGVWTSAPRTGWIVGASGATNKPGTSYLLVSNPPSYVALPSGSAQALRSVWGAGPNDVWAVGDWGAISHWDGGTWAETSAGWTGVVRSMWSAGGEDVWAVGQDFHAIRQPATGQWAVNPDAGIGLVFGLSGSAGNVWAVGSLGAIYLWDSAKGWVPDPNNTTGKTDSLQAVYSTPANGTWAVGANGAALWRGTTFGSWRDIHGGALTLGTLNDVWAANGAKADGWAVGVNGGIFRHTGDNVLGTTWKQEPSDAGTGVTFYGVWGSSASDVWAVGSSGTIVHSDGGTSWAAYPSGTTNDLYDVMGSSSGSVWAVGAAGTVVHWDGNGWTTQPFPGSDSNISLYSLSIADGGVWAGGSLGTILHLPSP